MLIEQLFEPWYEYNPIYDPMYGGGYVPIPWDSCEYDLNFGRIQKKDIDLKDQIELIKLARETGAVQDPIEMRSLLEDAGLGLREEYGQQMNQQYNNYGAYPPGFEAGTDTLTPNFNDMGGGPIFDNTKMGSPPMDMPIYDDMMIDVRGPNPKSDPRLTFTKDFPVDPHEPPYIRKGVKP
jgi:hypothetical protein